MVLKDLKAPRAIKFIVFDEQLDEELQTPECNDS